MTRLDADDPPEALEWPMLNPASGTAAEGEREILEGVGVGCKEKKAANRGAA